MSFPDRDERAKLEREIEEALLKEWSTTINNYKKAIEWALPHMSVADQFIVNQFINGTKVVEKNPFTELNELMTGYFDDKGIKK